MTGKELIDYIQKNNAESMPVVIGFDSHGIQRYEELHFVSLGEMIEDQLFMDSKTKNCIVIPEAESKPNYDLIGY